MAPSWDYQHAYPGGPAVTTIPLPRPLYPPGAKGHTPSDPGPDILAAKRVISRLGRWPWGAFDDQFSKAFSLGKSGGAVKDSGVAGFQRQMKIQDSGFVGTKTYNSWRNCRIPEGLPHAGEPAMDVTAINLFGEAWAIYEGKPTPPPHKGTLRQAALAKAQSQLGIKESPPESNNVKYCSWYYDPDAFTGPWCAMFATWSYETEGNSPSFVQGVRYAYVPYIVSDAQSSRYGLSVTSSPVPGDLVCFDWQRDGTYDHVGLVEKPPDSSGNFVAIEGNTSTGSDSDGGEVMRRNRNRNSQGTIFVRVAEP